MVGISLLAVTEQWRDQLKEDLLCCEAAETLGGWSHHF